MKKHSVMYYKWNYCKWYIWGMASTVFALLLLALLLFLLSNKQMQITSIECGIGIALIGILWSVLMLIAIRAMEKINGDYNYLPVRRERKIVHKTNLFTGKETVVSASAAVPLRITYLFAWLVFSDTFRRKVKNDIKMQRKYRNKENYKAARKREVNKTIEQVRLELEIFEVLSFSFLLVYVLAIVGGCLMTRSL